jgi:hypothetical protein
MPVSFWVGASALVFLALGWVVLSIVLRNQRRRAGEDAALGSLSPRDRAAAAGQLAGGRDAQALAMAVRGGQARQGGGGFF